MKVTIKHNDITAGYEVKSLEITTKSGSTAMIYEGQHGFLIVDGVPVSATKPIMDDGILKFADQVYNNQNKRIKELDEQLQKQVPDLERAQHDVIGAERRAAEWRSMYLSLQWAFRVLSSGGKGD